MRAVRLIVAGLAISLVGLAVGGEAGKLKEQLLGKWKASQKAGEIEVTMVFGFEKDGKTTMSIDLGKDKKIEKEGTYKVLDNSSFEVTYEENGKQKTEKVTVHSISDQKLVVSGGAGKKIELMKVKADKN